MHVATRTRGHWRLAKRLSIATITIALTATASLVMLSTVLAADTNSPRRDRTPLRGMVTVSLQPRVVDDAGTKHLFVDLVFKNVSDVRVRIGQWLALSTCQIRSRSLQISDADGSAITLHYRTIDHGDEEALGPGESLKVVGLDVTESFEFPQTPQSLWMSLDTIGWVDEPRAVEVKSPKVQFVFVAKNRSRSGWPREGHVVKREKHEGEMIVTCGM